MYMWFLVFTMLFNGGLIPTYILINNLHMLDTIWALVLPGAVPVFNVIILMNFFKNLPDELDEAARIDGANPWVIMVRIFIPLAVPSIATVTLFSIVNHWNAFLTALFISTLHPKSRCKRISSSWLSRCGIPVCSRRKRSCASAKYPAAHSMQPRFLSPWCLS